MKKKRKYIYLEKCLIIRILQIYIFSFYDFLFFISLSDVGFEQRGGGGTDVRLVAGKGFGLIFCKMGTNIGDVCISSYLVPLYLCNIRIIPKLENI